MAISPQEKSAVFFARFIAGQPVVPSSASPAWAISRRPMLRRRALRRRLRAPQCAGGNPRAFDQGFQLRPHDRRMDAAREWALREAAIGAAHDVFAASDLRQADDALGNEFRVLDDIGGVADHAGDQNLSGLKLHGLPYAPLVSVAGIGGLERIMAGANLQQQSDNVFERHVERMGSVPAAPAD